MKGGDIMKRTEGDICDLVDQASNGKEALEAVIRAYQGKQF